MPSSLGGYTTKKNLTIKRDVVNPHDEIKSSMFSPLEKGIFNAN
jgi:hypothetical protein